jgi:uncharacterized protein
MRALILWTVTVLSALALASCDGAKAPPPTAPKGAAPMTNPVFHFEIPVTDMDRAVQFYEAVFATKLTRQKVDGYDMAFFPRADGKPGASGALAKGDVYVPSKTGAILYFDVADIDETLRRAEGQGAKILYPKKDIGDGGFVAEIEDSEGNRIALNMVRK